MILHYCFVCLFPKGYVFEDISNVACLDFIDLPIIFRLSCMWACIAVCSKSSYIIRSSFWFSAKHIFTFVPVSDFVIPFMPFISSWKLQSSDFKCYADYFGCTSLYFYWNRRLLLYCDDWVRICCVLFVGLVYLVFSILVTGLNNLWYNVYWTVAALCTSFLCTFWFCDFNLAYIYE